MVVEMLVLREAVVWCMANRFTQVRFESDVKVVIDKINKADARDSQIGALMEEVLQYFAIHGGMSVHFVGRRSNRVAHLVARKAVQLYPIASRFFDFVAWLNSMI
ncbi:unnamed protein product [Linum trigynum]|uniref:RNase H type-1 domain-containing protein n=1 Tax=Linum trigynum TaxID=586398 RepID=A0AAV2FQE6_9ROSI